MLINVRFSVFVLAMERMEIMLETSPHVASQLCCVLEMARWAKLSATSPPSKFCPSLESPYRIAWDIELISAIDPTPSTRHAM